MYTTEIRKNLAIWIVRRSVEIRLDRTNTDSVNSSGLGVCGGGGTDDFIFVILDVLIHANIVNLFIYNTLLRFSVETVLYSLDLYDVSRSRYHRSIIISTI